MSGFTKSVRPAVSTGSRTALRLGIPTLDTLVKVQPGTITAIYEDEFSYIHNTVLQIFTSESLLQGRRPVRALAMEPKHLFYFEGLESSTDSPGAQQKFTIAWRYTNLGTARDSFRWDLASKVDLGPEHTVDSLNALVELLKREKHGSFTVYSLFAPLYPSAARQEILKVMFEMRKYARLNHHAILLSVPAFLLDTDLSPFLDNILELSSLLAMPNEKARFHGLLTLKKTSSLGALEVRNWDSVKYSVKITSKTFFVKKIDIPPEESAAPGGASCSQSF